MRRVALRRERVKSCDQPTLPESMPLGTATLQPCNPSPDRRSSLLWFGLANRRTGWAGCCKSRESHEAFLQLREVPHILLLTFCLPSLAARRRRPPARLHPSWARKRRQYETNAPCSRPGWPVQQQPTWNPFTSFPCCRWLRGWTGSRPDYNYYTPLTPIPPSGAIHFHYCRYRYYFCCRCDV